MHKIFIVEDDYKIAAILKKKMEQYGYEAATAANFRELMPELLAFDPHLVLLDINLPYFDGYYWCRQIRMRSSLPIIYISARSGEMDQVMAIENGGDDYVTKPIQLELLMAKVKGALRRTYGEYAAMPLAGENGRLMDPISSTTDAAGAESRGITDSSPSLRNSERAPASGSSMIQGGFMESGPRNAGLAKLAQKGLRLYPVRNEVEWKGHRLELTKNELLLAECLFSRPGEVLSREELLEALWDDIQFVDDNTLTVNVTRLRKKLEELGIPKLIDTVRGQGYKLSEHKLEEYGDE